jgi:hypothetical protein
MVAIFIVLAFVIVIAGMIFAAFKDPMMPKKEPRPGEFRPVATPTEQITSDTEQGIPSEKP